ncbi:hypothetical protein LAZ67_23001798 [Cordylochernes scorpioides]|uniref:Transposase n=1 Tax=Cordylochernes scorpioides TaxID=51811 RepID=A0ABY6LRA3_9ARAC|nr:hypothetical protein LAZ67_23001798 [Cordylochernes scorpioides]
MPGHRKRRQFKQTDAFTRGMVIGLKRAGWSIRQIAADTHLGVSTVHRLWRRWLEQGNVAIYRNVGATGVTSARVDRRILRQAVAAPQATCTAILQHVQDTLDHSISTRTISRRLVANGLHSCRPLRRLPLTPPNRRQRLEWCRARSTWMTEWHRVVFSDESRFCLSSDSRRVRVWRRRGERSNPAAIVERPTVRQGGIMVWGAIAYDSRSPLLRIRGTMTAQRYVDDVLRPVTLPYLQGVPNALYQQDNARPHTARISQQALQDVQMLPWPPYFHDLSPIEHVWDIIGRRLHALPQPRSEDELWQMVEREWRAIPQDAIRTLIDSLPRRVAACIAVRGESEIRAAYKLNSPGRVSVERSITETIALMNEAYEDEKLSRTQVYLWYKRFKDGRKNIADDSRLGRPLTSTAHRNIRQILLLLAASVQSERPPGSYVGLQYAKNLAPEDKIAPAPAAHSPSKEAEIQPAQESILIKSSQPEKRGSIYPLPNYLRFPPTSMNYHHAMPMYSPQLPLSSILQPAASQLGNLQGSLNLNGNDNEENLQDQGIFSIGGIPHVYSLPLIPVGHPIYLDPNAENSPENIQNEKNINKDSQKMDDNIKPSLLNAESQEMKELAENEEASNENIKIQKDAISNSDAALEKEPSKEEKVNVGPYTIIIKDSDTDYYKNPYPAKAGYPMKPIHKEHHHVHYPYPVIPYPYPYPYPYPPPIPMPPFDPLRPPMVLPPPPFRDDPSKSERRARNAQEGASISYY